MPVYAYTAKRGPKELTEGTIEAESQGSAVQKLGQQGLYPVRVIERTPLARERGQVIPLPWQARVGLREMVLFTRELATLLEAGQPILAALAILYDQTASHEMQEVVGALRTAVREGQPFSEAIAQFPRVFSKVYVNLVRAGEASGTLDAVLNRLADFYERHEETRSEVLAASAYPLIIAAVGMFSVIFLLTFVMPNLVGIFEDLGQRLPLPTQILLAASTILRRFWWAVFAVVMIAWGLIQRIRQAPEGREGLDRVLLRVPQLGRFLQQLELAQFARTLSALLANGIPVLQAIDLVAETVRLEPMRQELGKIRQGVAAGHALSRQMREGRLFPPFVYHLVAVGEESGRVDQALEKAAAAYDRQVAWSLKMFTTLLGPFMILTIGGLIGFIVVAMLLPIFQINLVIR